MGDSLSSLQQDELYSLLCYYQAERDNHFLRGDNRGEIAADLVIQDILHESICRKSGARSQTN